MQTFAPVPFSDHIAESLRVFATSSSAAGHPWLLIVCAQVSYHVKAIEAAFKETLVALIA